MTKRWKWAAVIVLAMLVGLLAAVYSASADEQLHVSTDSELAGKLGLLLGDGNGLTEAYLSKRTTRLQAAILFLRLKGLQDEALSYAGSDNFSDAGRVSKSNQAVLAYLKANPDLGWTGVGGGKFDPLSAISASQYYKVVLEALGYKTGADFEYKDVLAYAESKGLSKTASTKEFKNADIATATIEALQAALKGETKTLGESLAEMKLVDAATVAELKTERVDIAMNAELGGYLADGAGRALYYFTKDAENLNSCEGQCIVNWPIFYSERLTIGSGLNKTDFGAFTREDGTKQLTYKGWPLYYFAKDAQPGDIKGENVGKVWFVLKQPDYSVMLATNTKLGNYLTDSKGRTLYYFDKDPEGSSVCSGQCLVNWPVFHADRAVAPTGVNAADFGEITRQDGTKQTTYKGYPLYFFVKDAKMGDVLGQDVNQVWFVVNPEAFDGTTVGKAAAAAGTAEPAAGTAHQIDMVDFSFSKTDLKIKAGDSVTFTNKDDMEHNAVAVNGSFQTPLLKKGESFTVKFDKAGVYDYFCEPHKRFMIGKITVE